MPKRVLKMSLSFNPKLLGLPISLGNLAPSEPVSLSNQVMLMMELQYIQHDGHKLAFTNAGLDYMWQRHQDFVKNILPNVELPSGFSGLEKQLLTDFSNRSSIRAEDCKDETLDTELGGDWGEYHGVPNGKAEGEAMG